MVSLFAPKTASKCPVLLSSGHKLLATTLITKEGCKSTTQSGGIPPKGHHGLN